MASMLRNPEAFKEHSACIKNVLIVHMIIWLKILCDTQTPTQILL